MKILYAIQGTGNGHVSRAREVIPILQQYGDVDLLISGTQADVGLPYSIKYQLNGFGFVFGKKEESIFGKHGTGSIQKLLYRILKTYRCKNMMQLSTISSLSQHGRAKESV
jgi:hypothetical protein